MGQGGKCHFGVSLRDGKLYRVGGGFRGLVTVRDVADGAGRGGGSTSGWIIPAC